MRDQLPWMTRYSWQLVLPTFQCNWTCYQKTTFLWPLEWSFKTGYTTLSYIPKIYLLCYHEWCTWWNGYPHVLLLENMLVNTLVKSCIVIMNAIITFRWSIVFSDSSRNFSTSSRYSSISRWAMSHFCSAVSRRARSSVLLRDLDLLRPSLAPPPPTPPKSWVDPEGVVAGRPSTWPPASFGSTLFRYFSNIWVSASLTSMARLKWHSYVSPSNFLLQTAIIELSYQSDQWDQGHSRLYIRFNDGFTSLVTIDSSLFTCQRSEGSGECCSTLARVWVLSNYIQLLDVIIFVH